MEKIVKRTITLTLLGLMCICAVFAQSQVNLDTAIQQACNEVTGKLAMAPRVALLGFNSTNELSAYVLREMTSILGRNRAATWISRQETDRAMNAANLRASGDISDAAARQVGRNLNASYVITGALVQTGGNYRLRTRMIAVNNGSVQASSDIAVADNAQLRQLLGTAVAAPAPAQAPAPAPVQAQPAPAQAPAPAPVQTPAPAAAQATYKVGDTGPAGGFVFYDKGNNSGGWRYLEAAPEDLSRKLLATAENINIDDNRERVVGRGKSNTASIMKEAARLGGGFGWAAQACDVYTFNGFDDWFLPSRDEIHHMYGNLHMQNIGGFRNESYWTSTADSSGWWWAENFSNGRQDTSSRGSELRVRPVRQF